MSIQNDGNVPSEYRHSCENTIQIVPVPMPAKIELRGLMPLIEKLKGNPDKLECLGLELQMTIDRYTEEVEEELKSCAETSRREEK